MTTTSKPPPVMTAPADIFSDLKVEEHPRDQAKGAGRRWAGPVPPSVVAMVARAAANDKIKIRVPVTDPELADQLHTAIVSHVRDTLPGRAAVIRRIETPTGLAGLTFTLGSIGDRGRRAAHNGT